MNEKKDCLDCKHHDIVNIQSDINWLDICKLGKPVIHEDCNNCYYFELDSD